MHVFVLLGKTNSYKDYILSFCSHNPAINVTTKDKLDESKINVLEGSIDYCAGMKTASGVRLRPVFISTPAEQIIMAGLKSAVGEEQISKMCETFLNEGRIYSEDKLYVIEAHTIEADNACDACIQFMDYVKQTVGSI